ncbi:LysR family transcriptional regulator [Rhodoligotrophos ferricapiens]|uniref:LysR family transcriptional regulator n=1 Tax=Rhodoligotrophos ferricapiens TaxID=3069264 RepID=UPI00315CD13F
MTSITDLDLRLMQVFLTVVENRGLAAAQTSLNVGLSTISSHMATLEKRLGVKLCDRGRGGFRLTEEGLKVYEIARRLTGAVSAANSELAGLRDILVGKLRIGIVDNIVNNPRAAVHRAIHLFDRRDHEVTVTVEVVSPRDLERQVSDGMLDVGVGPRLSNLGVLDYDLLFTERQYLYCSRLHPLFELAPHGWSTDQIASEKYASHVCPLPDEPGYKEVLRGVTMVHNMESAAILILSGRFIGFLPEHYAQHWEARGDMRPIKTQQYFYDNLFYNIRRNSEKQSRIISQFSKDLKSAHKANQKMLVS